MTGKAGEGGLPDGQSIGIEMPVKLENDTTADVMFGYTVEALLVTIPASPKLFLQTFTAIRQESAYQIA